MIRMNQFNHTDNNLICVASVVNGHKKRVLRPHSNKS